MSNEFKIGSIADLINSNASSEGKKTKMAKRFGKVIAQNKDRVIKIEREIGSDRDKGNVNERKSQMKSDSKWRIDVKPMETNQSGDKKKRKNADHSQQKKAKKLKRSKSKFEEKSEDIDENIKEVVEQDEEIEDSVSGEVEKETEKDKLQRTIFVGNLPKTFTLKRLRKLFIKFGGIQSVRLRGGVSEDLKMPKKVAIITKKLHKGVDSIHGYVVFKSLEYVQKSLQMNGTLIEGHHIRVDTASKNKSYDSHRAIFVGNLPFVTKDDELHEFFQECGDIEAVRVVRDTKTGLGKGFAFVLFKTNDSVILALEMNQKEFKGRELRVSRAESNKSFNKPNDSQPDERPKEKKSKLSEKNKSNTRQGFGGIAAKKMKKKIKKKKEINATKAKKKQKTMAQIFAK